MVDNKKTKKQLLDELSNLRERLTELESNRLDNSNIHKNSTGTEEIFKKLFELSALGMGVITAKGIWQKVNPSMCRILGYIESELVSTSIYTLIHHDDSDIFIEAVNQVLSGRTKNLSVESRLAHKEGRFIGVRVTVSIIGESLHKMPPVLFIEINDITDTKNFMKIFTETRNSFTAMYNTIKETLFVITPEGTVLHINKTGAKRYNKSIEELQGKCIFDVVPPRVAKKRKEIIAQVIKTCEPFHFITNENGRVLDVTVSPIFDSGWKPVKVGVYAQDITDLTKTLVGLKERERQQAAVVEFGNYALTQKDLLILMKKAAEIISLTLKVPYIGVWELSPTSGKLEIKVASKLIKKNVVFENAEFCLNINDTISGHTVKTEKTIVIRDVKKQTRFQADLLSKMDTKSIMVVPLKLHDHIYGTLALLSTKKRSFTNQDIHFCEAIANILASAIEQNRAENALKISDATYRAVVEDQTDIICRFSTDGTITFANNVLCNLLKKEAKEICGLNLKYFIRKNVLKEVFSTLLKLTPDNPTKGIEHRISFPKGKISWINFKTRAIFDNNGQLIEFQSVGRDITEKKHAELLLSENEKYYRHLVEFMPAAMFIFIDGKFAFVNKAFLKLLGLNSPSEILKRDVLNFIPPHFHSSIVFQARNLCNKGTISQLSEHQMIRSDGSVVDVESSASPFPYNNQTATLVVVRDLSERNRNKELNKKMEEKSRLLNEAIEYDKLKTEFFSNISHELKTPLSVIFVTLQLLKLKLEKSSMSSEDTGKHLSVMKQNCYRLLKLVNNIIDITKIDAKFYVLNLENKDIVDVIREVTLSVEDYIKEKNLDLHFETKIKEKVIAFDVEKIERIMLNLLSNAVKFTQPGGKITVSVQATDKNVIITVKDSGIGIPKEKLGLIFERFMQVDKSLRRNHEGSGIGLSIVKSLVEMHGGKTYALSDYGKGSEFIVELPQNTVSEKSGSIMTNSSIEQHGAGKIKIEFSDIM